MSLDDIEVLTNTPQLSNTYIIPRNQSLSKPYGLVFYTTKDRPGAQEEALTVMKALEQIKMTVFTNCWDNFDNMREGLSNKLTIIKDECSFLFVSIMAHGFKGHVVGNDGSRGQINDLLRVIELELKPSIPVVSISVPKLMQLLLSI